MRITASLSGKDWRILGLLPTEWVWRRIGQPGVNLDDLQPPPAPWISATVPGDVQSDLRDADEIPDPWFGRNSRACEWTSQRDWVYRKEFAAPPEMQGRKRIRLRFGGVDFSCHVFLNGQHLGDHVGMYDPFFFDVTDVLHRDAPNTLLVVIDHAPPEPANQGQIGWTNQIRLWKARFAYDWDWCTRLIPLGIWQDVTLEADDGVRIEDVWVRPLLNEARDAADVVLHIALEGSVRGRLIAAMHVAGEEAPFLRLEEELLPGQESVTLSLPVKNPELWYPNGYGGQPLYEAVVTLKGEEGATGDENIVRFGIRQIRFLPNENAPEDALPYLLEVNGLRVFMKGWNWVPIDQLYGRPHTEKYRHGIRLAKEAHCNLLRVWGGGLLEREQFYDLCDEAGILVWQEFIQSSSGIDNEPATDADYIAYCREQAEKMIPQRRNHPSLFLWCGGNELMTPDWKPLANSHPTLAALRETVERLDPDRLFLPTSPSGPIFGADPAKAGQMHDVHGNWKYLGDPAHTCFFNAIDPLLHSEFGVEGAANIEAFARFLPPESFWPPDATNPDWTHHGSWWLNRATVEALFGPLDNLDDFVRASQWVQAEGLRYGVEANRRRKWRTSGAIPWQFNEAWPNASCTNVVDYYGQLKPAYWWLRRAYAPFLASASYEKLQWQPGEEFAAEIWLNRSEAAFERPDGDARVHWRLYDVETGRTLAEDSVVVPQAALAVGAVRVAAIRHRLPSDYRGAFALQLTGVPDDLLEGAVTRRISAQEEFLLTTHGALLERNEYLFSASEGAPFASLLHLPPARLQIRQIAPAYDARTRLLTLRNIGSVPALYVTVSFPDAPLGVALSGNYRTLQPGERWQLRVGSEESAALSEGLAIRVSAWNVAPRQLKVGT